MNLIGGSRLENWSRQKVENLVFSLNTIVWWSLSRIWIAISGGNSNMKFLWTWFSEQSFIWLPDKKNQSSHVNLYSLKHRVWLKLSSWNFRYLNLWSWYSGVVLQSNALFSLGCLICLNFIWSPFPYFKC